jgi:cation:H+ antiporter
MMLLDILLLVVGAALVLFGADKLTDGATGLARRFNISEMVIGLTVVAFGTSLPEFVTSFVSTLKGSADISMGNVVGSNLFNTLFIVGSAAAVSPIVISKATVQKDIPFALLASLMLVVVSMDVFFDGASLDVLSRTDGIVLLGFFSIFMAYTMFMARNTKVIDTQSSSDDLVVQMPYWRISL